MEPPSIDGGNVYACVTLIASDIGLQWSRRRSTAEIFSSAAKHSPNSTCFNGAAVDRRRKSGRGPGGPGGAGDASMEPPSIDGGNPLRASVAAPSIRASMEPPSIDGGNSLASTGTGAPPSLQWSRRRSTAEMTEAMRTHRMAGRLQWSRRRSTAEMVHIAP